jgi:VWFA-related protein
MSMSRSLPMAALVCLAVGHSSARAQTAEAWSPRLVKLSVVAIDGRGRSVTDLAASEFSIADAGKAQAVAVFRYSESQVQPAAPRPGEMSNRGGARVNFATLILFDMLNQSMSMQSSVKDFLARGLQPLETADHLYLYVLTPKGELLAVRGLSGGDAPAAADAPWTKNIRPLLDRVFATAFQIRPREMTLDERVRLTFGAMTRIGSGLTGIPGRKSVVWITRGAPIAIGTGFDQVNYEPALGRLCQSLSRVGVAVYPVQLLGDSISPESQDTMKRFAEFTGGLKLSDDVGATVRQAMSDSRSSYLIGYYPPRENWDGQFHKLRVTCARKGVRVQVRTGYYATEEAEGSEKAALDDALSASFDASEIGITGSATAGATPPGAAEGRMTHLAFHIDAADLGMVEQDGRWVARLSFQLAGFLRDGRMERLRVIPADLTMTAAGRDRALREGISFTRDILLGDSVQKVRLAAFDRMAHAVGALTVPVVAAPR